jgi:ADP-heptose:LPS heptosyltransferase
VDAVSRALGLSQPDTLHPSLLYRALAPFWRDEAGFELVERHTKHRQLAPFDHPASGPLPADYIAVRFYASDSFPDTAANRRFARSMTAALARSQPVVILNPGARVDDHADFSPHDLANVVTLPAALPAEDNLAVQSAVISRARAFIGTYGGLAYVAPFYGVPSMAFYSDRAFKLHHLHVAQRVLERLGSATVTAIDIADARFVSGS